jgi:hypothetical protein
MPRTDAKFHTAQFYGLGDFNHHGPFYYLWLGKYYTDPRILNCPSSLWTLDYTWTQSAAGEWQPRPGGECSYQCRLWLSWFKGVRGTDPVTGVEYGQLKPIKFGRIGMVVDHFGNWNPEEYPTTPNHPTEIWNVLYTDGSVVGMNMKSKNIPGIQLRYYEAGDYLVGDPDTQNVALLWKWFDGVAE